MVQITIERRRDIEDVLHPLSDYAYNCHAASIAIVRAEVLPGARVARGAAEGVMGQHSWVVLGPVYQPKAVIDPTKWSYDGREPQVDYLTRASQWRGRYTPHGSGSIYSGTRPCHRGGQTIELEADLSTGAKGFLAMIGPLDNRGWMMLFNSPVQGWPSAEIVAAAYAQESLRAYIPIDIVGHLTDHNPGGLYLPVKESADV